jgi:hypothetical protein
MGSHDERKPSLNLADAVTSLISLRSRAENVLPSTALRQYVAQSFVFQRWTHSNFGKMKKLEKINPLEPSLVCVRLSAPTSQLGAKNCYERTKKSWEMSIVDFTYESRDLVCSGHESSMCFVR